MLTLALRKALTDIRPTAPTLYPYDNGVWHYEPSVLEAICTLLPTLAHDVEEPIDHLELVANHLGRSLPGPFTVEALTGSVVRFVTGSQADAYRVHQELQKHLIHLYLTWLITQVGMSATAVPMVANYIHMDRGGTEPLPHISKIETEEHISVVCDAIAALEGVNRWCEEQRAIGFRVQI